MKNETIGNIFRTGFLVFGVYVISAELKEYGLWAILVGGVSIYIALAIDPKDFWGK